jgi:methionyl-tRNA formyltransferase
MKTPSIVFFGTGPVAAASLAKLAKHTSIEAVITKPKPTHHRGSFPVIDCAKKLKIPLYYATNRLELDDLMKGVNFQSEVGVLIDYGIIVSQKVIDVFDKGIINSHFSLLPQWRGADPITFALLSGQSKTGVSIMLLDQGMDTGPLLKQKSLVINSQDTNQTLTQSLIELSDQLLQESLTPYLEGKLRPRQQPHPDRATYSRKITKADGILDWNKPAEQLEREIRAFHDWPKSKTHIGNIAVIITEAHAVANSDSKSNPGHIEITQNTGNIQVGCSTGRLQIERLKPLGKKEMSAAAFIAGYSKKLQ